MARVFVCGDIHGSLDILKLTARYWPEGRTLTRDDYLVVLGDFGLLWSVPASEAEAFWLDWLEARPWTTLFVDGNHENHDLLDGLEVTSWKGGQVHVVPDHSHIIHLMRGQVYDVGDHGTWFTFGGARSHDRQWRVEGRSWWAREMPSLEEYERGLARLAEAGWSVDYVFTHDTTTSRLTRAMPWFVGYHGHAPEADELTDYLMAVDDRLDEVRLRAWYCGHYHDDLALADERHLLLYRQVVELGQGPLTHASPGTFVAGAGRVLPEADVELDEAARLVCASEEDLSEFLSRQGLEDVPDNVVLTPQGVQALRKFADATYRRRILAAGPGADIS